MRLKATWTAIRSGDATGRMRTMRDGQAALRLSLGAAGLRTGVLDALREGASSTAGLSRRIGAEDDDLLESFLRVLQSAGHVRVRGAVWQLTRSTARWLDDDLVRAGYEAFSEYHTGLYRDLDSQLRGGPPRYDVRDRGEVIARVSAGFEPFVVDLLRRTVGERSPARVLDVGCGSGLELAAMLSEAPDATGTGIEVDRDVAELARRTLATRGLAGRATVVAGDLLDVAADGGAGLGGPFDLALLANVIYYLPVASRASFLRRVGGLLTSGGTLVVVTTAATPAMFSRHFDLLLRAQEGAMALPELGALAHQLRQAGFRPGEPERLVPGQPLYAVLATTP